MEARAKFRRLTDCGSIQDYVKEFTELRVEIPSMTDVDALFAFVNGLQLWVRLEVQRDLAFGYRNC